MASVDRRPFQGAGLGACDSGLLQTCPTPHAPDRPRDPQCEAIRQADALVRRRRDGRNLDTPISNNTMLFALYRLGYKGKMTGQGFRAVASTALNETGWHADVIKHQLAHKESNKVRGAYNRAEYLPERRKMMQAWAGMVDAYARGADVVPIKRVTA